VRRPLLARGVAARHHRHAALAVDREPDHSVA
jgi:hypothetical protein